MPTPSVTFWSRLEPRPRSNDLRTALAARVRDPAWLLARQWQLGEFAGEDAGSPAYMKITTSISAIGSWAPVSGTAKSFDQTTTPLEKVALSEQFSDSDLGMSVELGVRFERLLVDQGMSSTDRATVMTLFRGTYSIAPTVVGEDAISARYRRLWAGRSLAGVPLYLAAVAASPALPTPGESLDPSLQGPTLDAINAFIAGVGEDFVAFGTADPTTWSPERLEYVIHAHAKRPTDAVIFTMSGEPDREGSLDWYAFEETNINPGYGSGPAPVTTTMTVLPAPMRFRGMPNARFWDFEEGTVDFGGVLPDKRDLATLLLVDFMLVHGNDWFVIPLTVPAGSLCSSTVTVKDVFGLTHTINPANQATSPRWSMFSTLKAEDSTYAAFSMFPATVGRSVQDGAPIEEVRFLRDEQANLAWAIERTTESHLGRPTPGADRGAPTPPPEPPTTAPLRYRIQTYVPYNWIPFQAVPKTGGSPGEIVLQRGRMLDPAATPGGPPMLPTPLGRILMPSSLAGGAYFVREEEIPREGTRVTRVVRWSRWTDGSTHVWIARQRFVGTGEGYSGLQFDLALPTK